MVKKVRSSGNKSKQNKFALKPIRIDVPGQGKRTLPVQEALVLAQRWLRGGQHAPAIQLLRQVTLQVPGFADAWMMLFAALNTASDTQGILLDAQRCLNSKPRFIPALTSLSIAKRTLQQHADALQLIDKAIKLEPTLDELHNHRGVILKEMGRSDAALASFSRCLAIQPANTNAIWNRSDMIAALPEKEYERCRALASNDKINPNQRAMTYYALGRSDEASRNYAAQFDHIQAGADLKRSTVSYQHSAEIRQIENAAQAFPNSSPSTTTPAHSESATPVFICGLPRSGTTLTEQILSSHSAVVAGDELNDLPRACSQWLARNGIRKTFPDWAPDLSEAGWSAIGDAYMESTQSLHRGGYFTDKNLQNYKAIGVIRKALPQAKIVICRRNPMDNLWGCYRQFFSEGMFFTYKQEELADIWNASERLIQHWQATGNDIFLMEYETLIHKPQETVQALLEFVGLPWDDACLNFHENKRTVSTLSATQVRKPLSANRLEQWKRYETQLQPMRKRLAQL